MPLYSYECTKCNLVCEKYYSSIGIAAPFVDGCKCDVCDGHSIRIYDKPAALQTIGAGGRPIYSNPADPKKGVVRE